MRTGMPGVMMGCSLAAALAVAGPVGAQTDGALTWSVTGAANGAPARTMVQYFHGSQMRIEMPGASAMGGAGMIMDASTGTMTMLMPTQKMYMQYNIADMAANMPQQPQQGSTPVSVTASGTETVAGISCTDYMLTGGPVAATSGGATEICAAPGVPTLDPTAFTKGPMAQFSSRMGMNAQVVAAYQQLKGKGPLKVSRVENGTKSVVMVVTKVDLTPPPASMFEVPAGFTKLAMPAGAGMPPGMAGPPKSP